MTRDLIVENYKQFGGTNPYTTSICNVAAQLGLVAPHTNEPFSEAMMLGIGGGIGIGAGYMMIDYKVISAMVMIGTRHLWHSDNVEFMRRICARIGSERLRWIKETTGKKAAESNLEIGDRRESRRPWPGSTWRAFPIPPCRRNTGGPSTTWSWLWDSTTTTRWPISTTGAPAPMSK